MVVLVFFCSFGFLDAITVGSDSAPSRQGSVTFLEADTDNEMNGFGAFEGGVTFETVDTTCTFDSFLPISGAIDIRGGTIYLTKNVRFDSATSLTNMGSVYGNGLSVECSESITTLTVYESGGTAGSSSSWNQVDSHSELLSIYGVDWTYDDQYVVHVKNDKLVEVLSFNGSALGTVDDVRVDTNLLSVCAHPSAYYFVTGGGTSGPKKELSLIKLVGSTLSVPNDYDIDVQVDAVDWSADGNYVAIATDSPDTRVYSFASEALSQVGSSLSLGTNESASRGALCWDQTGDYYVLGVAHSSSSKVRIYNFNGSSITAKDFVDTGADNVLAVDWAQTGDLIAIGTGGSSNQLRVYEYDSGTDSLDFKTQISVGGAVNSVHWNSDATVLLVGKALDGGGTELRVYTYNQASPALTLDKEAEKSTDINSVRWSYDDSYFAYGDSANNIVVYSYEAGAEDTSYFSDSVILDNVNFILNNDMSWKMATTIQGECTIDARDNIITIEDTGVLTLESGAQLTIENAELRGFTNQNFICADDTVAIVLRNCVIRLDNDFSFGTGSLLFEGDVIFTGTNKFVYASAQESSIAPNATLMFDHDTTFSYAPSTANRDLLSMTDETSFFYLNGCTLFSTATGIRLTKGTVFLDNLVALSCDGDDQSESICFGDGVASNDLTVKILSDALVDVSGAFCYENVN